MPGREVRAGNMNSVHDDVLGDIFSGNINFKAKEPTPPSTGENGNFHQSLLIRKNGIFHHP